MSTDDSVAYLRVPRDIHLKLKEMAKHKDRLKEWSVEAREILEKAVREHDAAEAATGGQTA